MRAPTGLHTKTMNTRTAVTFAFYGGTVLKELAPISGKNINSN